MALEVRYMTELEMFFVDNVLTVVMMICFVLMTSSMFLLSCEFERYGYIVVSSSLLVTYDVHISCLSGRFR